MKTINIAQGTPEWHQHRADYRNASEAPAACNDSPYMKRNELIHAKKTGDVKQFSEWFQKYILDKGHRFEALSRPLAEKILDDDLAPLVGVEGKFSASFDGLTFDRKQGFEHKTLNNAIRAAFTVDELPIYYREQMEHQLMVCGGERILFMATLWEPVGEDDNDPDATYGEAENERGVMTRYKLVEKVHFFYYPDMTLRQRIFDAWDQLEKDVADYEPAIIEQEHIPAAPKDLPAMVISAASLPAKQARDAFAKAAKELVAKAALIPQDKQQAGDLVLLTNQGAEQETAFKSFATQLDAHYAEPDAVRKFVGEMVKLFGRVRIDGSKGQEAWKANEKTRMVNAASAALRDHTDALNASLQRPIMPIACADFWAAIKGKSNPDNMQNDLDAMLAEKKIEADKIAELIRANLDTFSTIAEGFEDLFADDLQALCQKDADSFRAVVKVRIADHKEAEAKRAEQERLDAEAKRQREAQQSEQSKVELTEVAPVASQSADEITTDLIAGRVAVGVDTAAPGAYTAIDMTTGEIIKPVAAPVASLSPSYREPTAKDKLMRAAMQLNESEAGLALHYVERLIDQRQAAA